MFVRRLFSVSSVALVIACTFSACSSDSSGGNSSSAGCTTSLPAGSFAKSCSECSMSGTVLSCAGCGDGAGSNPPASIDTCSCPSSAATQGISNNHGVLECGSSGTSGDKCSPGSGECKNCKCGQSCFATAVCSTCTPRCGYSCTTDQDCKDLQAKYNLTVSYSQCVKTSPGHEIYKCQ